MRAGERGFAWVLVLVATAVLSLGLSAAGPRWADAERRAREAEWLRIGRCYAQALAQYRDRSPGAVRRYPQALEELLLDRRFVGTVRHLRRLYPDPLVPGAPWLEVRDAQGGIVGVRSRSVDPTSGRLLDADGRPLPQAARYADRIFSAEERP